MGAKKAGGKRGGEGSKSGGRRVRRKTERRENVTGERNVLIGTMQNIVFQKEMVST